MPAGAASSARDEQKGADEDAGIDEARPPDMRAPHAHRCGGDGSIRMCPGAEAAGEADDGMVVGKRDLPHWAVRRTPRKAHAFPPQPLARQSVR